MVSEKDKIRHFFKAYQKEFPNFKTPKVKKVLQKKDFVVTVSAGQGVGEPKPMYSATPFKFVKGYMKGVTEKKGVAVRGFKRLKGGKNFKSQVEAKAYANKLMRKL
jgi:hypothetical protein